jgi:hypothetical protein
MSAPSAMPSAQAVEIYIRAKDENRPYLMERAFAENAILEMIVNSGTISFPPISIGLQSISDVLVRRFAQTHENVHTFRLAAPPRNDEVNFSCDWLVGMSERTVVGFGPMVHGASRVGGNSFARRTRPNSAEACACVWRSALFVHFVRGLCDSVLRILRDLTMRSTGPAGTDPPLGNRRLRRAS